MVAEQSTRVKHVLGFACDHIKSGGARRRALLNALCSTSVAWCDSEETLPVLVLTMSEFRVHDHESIERGTSWRHVKHVLDSSLGNFMAGGPSEAFADGQFCTNNCPLLPLLDPNGQQQFPLQERNTSRDRQLRC